MSGKGFLVESSAITEETYASVIERSVIAMSQTRSQSGGPCLPA